MDCWSLKLTHKIINKKAAEFSCVVAAWIMQMWWSQLVWKMRNKWKAELFLNERSNLVFYLFGQRKEINAHSKRFLCSRGVYSENDFRAFHFISADWNPSFMQWRLFSPFAAHDMSSALKCARSRTVHQHATALHTLVSFESEFSRLTRFPSRIVLVIHVRSGHDAYDSIINVSLHISIIWQTHRYWFAIFVALRCEKMENRENFQLCTNIV